MAIELAPLLLYFFQGELVVNAVYQNAVSGNSGIERSMTVQAQHELTAFKGYAHSDQQTQQLISGRGFLTGEDLVEVYSVKICFFDNFNLPHGGTQNQIIQKFLRSNGAYFGFVQFPKIIYTV